MAFAIEREDLSVRIKNELNVLRRLRKRKAHKIAQFRIAAGNFIHAPLFASRLKPEPDARHEACGVNIFPASPRVAGCVSKFAVIRNANVGRELTLDLVSEPRAEFDI